MSLWEKRVRGGSSRVPVCTFGTWTVCMHLTIQKFFKLNLNHEIETLKRVIRQPSPRNVTPLLRNKGRDWGNLLSIESNSSPWNSRPLISPTIFSSGLKPQCVHLQYGNKASHFHKTMILSLIFLQNPVSISKAVICLSYPSRPAEVLSPSGSLLGPAMPL